MGSINIPKRLGAILLGVWLILMGLMALIQGFSIPAWIMGILALVAGILIILDR